MQSENNTGIENIDEFYLSAEIQDEILEDFVETQHDVMDKIRDALAVGDFKKAEILMHTLKTVAGMMVEEGLTDMALQMELTFKKKAKPSEEAIKNIETQIKKIIDR